MQVTHSNKWHHKIVGSLLLATVLLLSTSIPGAFAQSKKISGTGRAVAVLSETKMLPGDDPRHEITLVRRLEADKGTLGETQVSTTSVSDYVAGTGTHRGHRVSVFPDGDKAFSAYEGQTKTILKPGGPPEITFAGKWWFTGGTGKWKGITGNGTYKGEATPAGMTWEYEGGYEVRP